MKSLLLILCLPITIMAGDQSPVNWDKLEKQYLKVEELERQFEQLRAEHKQLVTKLSGQQKFLEEANKLQAELDTLDPQSILYEITTAPLLELEAKQQQEQEKLKKLNATLITTDRELEREVWYATGLEMRHDKEKLAGTAQIVKDREQRNLANQDNQRDGIPSGLKNAKRSGPDQAQETDQELFDDIRALEKKLLSFSQTLTAAGHADEDAPSESDLQKLFALQKRADDLKKELGQLVAAAHPEKNERLEYLEKLNSTAKRSTSATSITLIIPVLRVYSIHP